MFAIAGICAHSDGRKHQVERLAKVLGRFMLAGCCDLCSPSGCAFANLCICSMFSVYCFVCLRFCSCLLSCSKCCACVTIRPDLLPGCHSLNTTHSPPTHSTALTPLPHHSMSLTALMLCRQGHDLTIAVFPYCVGVLISFSSLLLFFFWPPLTLSYSMLSCSAGRGSHAGGQKPQSWSGELRGMRVRGLGRLRGGKGAGSA